MRKLMLTIFLLITVTTNFIIAQTSDYYIPVNIKTAYELKFRSWDGKPGLNYWQNRADYSIQVSLNPTTREISGEETIVYFNESPETLYKLIIHLFPNLYQKGHSRDFDVEFADESDGVTVKNIYLNGNKLDISSSSKFIEYSGTSMIVTLPEPLPSKNKMNLNISWNYELNKGSHNRTGAVDSTSFFVAYFFPRIAVYDDIHGWNHFNYTGTAEFYNDYGDFDVKITVPKNYLVWATGTLNNPEKVLAEPYLSRYLKASKSDKIIHIIDSTEYMKSISPLSNQQNTWNFKANTVTDFAFATSDHYLWDATSIVADSISDRRVLINVPYNKDSKDFYQVARIARQSMNFMCNRFPAVPFPFPEVTVFNGSDGMEYPMMVNNISKEDINETIKLTAHEILHSYLPFYVGTNESKYAWMDEGFTSFCDYLITSYLISPEKANFYFLPEYREQAGYMLDSPIFTVSEYLKRPVYSYNTYPKPAAFFVVLQDYLGDELFKKAIHEFMNRWHGKHPTPYDFFFTLEDITNQKFEWLIKPWFYEFGYVDLGIQNIMNSSDEYKITIEKVGNLPAPVKLKLEYTDGSNQVISKSAKIWQNEERFYTISGKTEKIIKSVELMDKSLIDANLKNNIIFLRDVN